MNLYGTLRIGSESEIFHHWHIKTMQIERELSAFLLFLLEAQNRRKSI